MRQYIIFHSLRLHFHTLVHTRVTAEPNVFCATMLHLCIYIHLHKVAVFNLAETLTRANPSRIETMQGRVQDRH